MDPINANDAVNAPAAEAVAAPVSANPPVAPKRTLIGAVMHWARDLMVSIVLAVVVILFLYQPVKVEGTSMMPTLDDQERIFINKFVYRLHFGQIDRGDTVVFCIRAIPPSPT